MIEQHLQEIANWGFMINLQSQELINDLEFQILGKILELPLTAMYARIELQFESSYTFNNGYTFSFQTSVMSKSYTTVGN